MEIYKILAEEQINKYKNHRTDGKNEAWFFIKEVRDLKTLCFDKRVPTFKNNEARYSFWNEVLSLIK